MPVVLSVCFLLMAISDVCVCVCAKITTTMYDEDEDTAAKFELLFCSIGFLHHGFLSDDFCACGPFGPTFGLPFGLLCADGCL